MGVSVVFPEELLGWFRNKFTLSPCFFRLVILSEPRLEEPTLVIGLERGEAKNLARCFSGRFSMEEARFFVAQAARTPGFNPS
jgi:hypothetical protein